jgi:hypothetical protein
MTSMCSAGIDESVDPVCLDPPFNSTPGYSVLFSDHGGAKMGPNTKEGMWCNC